MELVSVGQTVLAQQRGQGRDGANQGAEDPGEASRLWPWAPAEQLLDGADVPR